MIIIGMIFLICVVTLILINITGSNAYNRGLVDGEEQTLNYLTAGKNIYRNGKIYIVKNISIQEQKEPVDHEEIKTEAN